MAADLIAMLEQLLGSNEVLSRIGSLIGLSPERSRRHRRCGAGDSGRPGQLGTKARRPRSTRCRSPQPGSRRARQSGAMLGSGRQNSLIDSGSSLLTSLLGDSKVGALSGAIAKFAGLNQGSATSLLRLSYWARWDASSGRRAWTPRVWRACSMTRRRHRSGLAGRLGERARLDRVARRHCRSAGRGREHDRPSGPGRGCAHCERRALHHGRQHGHPAPKHLGWRLLAALAHRSPAAGAVGLAGLAVPAPGSSGGGGGRARRRPPRSVSRRRTWSWTTSISVRK